MKKSSPRFARWKSNIIVGTALVGVCVYSAMRYRESSESTLNFQDALSAIGPCASSVEASGEEMQSIYDALFGNTDFINVGFELRYLCRDIEDGTIAYIMARPKLEQISSEYLGCDGDCDELIFGMARYEDQKIIRSFNRLSVHQFGLFASSTTDTGVYCAIDHMSAERYLSDAELWLYCGNERDGGLTDWYMYTFATDSLLHVQELNAASPGGQVKVKDQYIQRGYHILENADIGSFIHQNDADFRAQIK
ncbi:MAG: hypothetical protein AAB473_03270 [Patescibacteria group bacterium]